MSLVKKRARGRVPLAQYDPFNALSLFDEFWPQERLANRETFSPAIDIRENENEYTVTLEAAGLSKEEINIEVENDVVTFSGEKKIEREEESEKYHRLERRYGSFSRSLRFADINAENVTASYKDGLLTVTVPKAEAVKPKRIEVE